MVTGKSDTTTGLLGSPLCYTSYVVQGVTACKPVHLPPDQGYYWHPKFSERLAKASIQG